MESLQKGRKDDIAALGEHAAWATQTLQHGGKEHTAHLNWLANGVKKNKGVLSPQHKQSIEHFASMYRLPHVRNANLSGKSLDEGISELANAEKEGIAKAERELVTPRGKVVAGGSKDRKWWNLGVAGDEEEARAGKHCGNTPALDPKRGRTHERLHSLRGDSVVPGKQSQHITAVSNDGFLTEIKGRANTKPKNEYHSDIVSLMESPNVKGLVGGGYLPGSNFNPEDVTDPVLKNRIGALLQKKPNFFSPDVSDLHQSIRQDPFLGFEVTNKGAVDENENGEKPLSYEEAHKLYHSSQPDSSTHRALARNPNLHLHGDLAQKLFHSSQPNSSTHLSLAQNSNLHQMGDLAQKLFHSSQPNSDTHHTLAQNSNLHQMGDLAQKLFHSSQPNSSTHLSLAQNSNLHQMGDLAHKLYHSSQPDSSTHRALARNPNLHLHGDLAQKLYHSSQPDYYTHRALAQNSNLHLHGDLAQKLYDSSQPDSDTHHALAQNPNLPHDLAHKLYDSSQPDSDTHRYLAQNPNTPQEILNEIEPHLIETIRAADEKDPDSVYRANNAAESLQELRGNRLVNEMKSPDIPLSFLQKYQFSHNEKIRNAAKEAIQKIAQKTKINKSQKNITPNDKLQKSFSRSLNESDAYSKNANIQKPHLISDVDTTKSSRPNVSGKTTDPNHFQISQNPKTGKEFVLKGPLNWNELKMGRQQDKQAHGHFLDPNFQTSHREAAFGHIAHNFFGLGKYVPESTLFVHPDRKEIWSSAEYTPNTTPMENSKQLKEAHTHDLHKLSIMDTLLGNNDRNKSNILVKPNGHPVSIDNGLAFDYAQRYSRAVPAYADHIASDDTPDHVHAWISSLNPHRFETTMDAAGVPKQHKETALKRLNLLKEWSSNVKKNPEMSQHFGHGIEFMLGASMENPHADWNWHKKETQKNIVAGKPYIHMDQRREEFRKAAGQKRYDMLKHKGVEDTKDKTRPV